VHAVRRTDSGIEVVDVDPPDSDGVRVQVVAAGICGSDLELLAFGPSPVTLGHEFAGTADDGRTVAVLPFVPCGTCDRCRAGAVQQCAAVTETMYGLARDGGMAEVAVVDPTCLAPLPADLALTDASLVEPLAVALHAINRGGVEEGMRVGVVGAGSIGLLCAAVAGDRNAVVDIAARHPRQREAAAALGAGVGLSGRYDVVFEAAGSGSAFADATRVSSRGGTVVLVSTGWHEVSVSFMAAQLKEVSIVPAFTYGHAHGEREFDTAAGLLARHPEWPATLVTHRFPLADAATAFRVAADRAAGAIKVVLHP
jgi:threonine dehydrogenase-like Zn-dependent dehydrogenase